ncbi:hypothetical protein [Plantactinospora sp. CA-290183]|uniref:hypothetical protein n=1 Tax=Plantactinospora sp. CA-290183 TaxID=3240006 RepID=UPI003D92DDAE
MGLFSRRQHRDPTFDLAALDLPRADPQAAEERATLANLGLSPSDDRHTVSFHYALSDIAARLEPMIPFVLASEEGPTVLVRLDGLPAAEVADLARAVEEGHCLLTASYRSYPTFPVLTMTLAVYDSADPFQFEGFRDVTLADVQDFVVELCRHGGRGKVFLYAGPDARQVAAGPFALRLPPFREVRFPHRTSDRDVQQLWKLLGLASTWLRQIPPQRRDFAAAARAHEAATAR